MRFPTLLAAVRRVLCEPDACSQLASNACDARVANPGEERSAEKQNKLRVCIYSE